MPKSMEAKPAVRYLLELPLKLNSDDTVLKKFMEGGGRIWCRVPNALQVYFRVVDFDCQGNELLRRYESKSQSFRFMTLSQEIVNEVLWLGSAEVNESEAIAILSECGKIEEKEVAEVALETMVADLRSSFHSSRLYPAKKRGIQSTVESFVLAKPSLAGDQGVQCKEVVESSFPVRLNDLFVAETDYQATLAGAVVDSVSETEKPDWMPSQLHLLNAFAESYIALESKRTREDELTAAVSKLEAELARELGESNLDSQKMVAAKRIIEGTAIFYPRPPVQPPEGAEKVSLLDIANSLAEHFWRGEVNKTKNEYKHVEVFNDHVNEILENHHVDHIPSLLPHLSRFIRFA
ncbi:hypothetical protein [Marinobacter alexandrii]|jgi:hypothetical protein|uniref:hypothetical protein n=1 Tax=Marinobacter alexandrii TaxID=2570351 RepID=UPI002ABE920B|nr:hypothetical protein [Marinobacter alexandrii]